MTAAGLPSTLPSPAPQRLRIADLEPLALAATRAAALACLIHVGRGDRKAADAAATEAMRSVLAAAPAQGRVAIGEGEKDEAPMLHNGERFGVGGPKFDIAVDPLECTTLCAKGLPGSLATIAFAQAGTLYSPGPAFYMDKLVVPPAPGHLGLVGWSTRRLPDARRPPNSWSRPSRYSRTEQTGR
jgi:fructose-1,6-bisphosphatase II